jgi:Ca2+/H+ antiporter, TMEM165/GDT1 family
MLAFGPGAAAGHLASVGIGYWVGDAFAEQQHWISIVAGVAFLGFAAWTLRGDELTEDEADKARSSQGAAILAVGVAFFPGGMASRGNAPEALAPGSSPRG